MPLFDRTCPRSFRMRDDGQEEVGLSVDLKVEPIPVIHPRLPDVVRLIVLLGPKRWMSKVGDQEGQLLVELRLPVFGELLILSAKAEREGRGHAVRRRRARTVAWAVGNGPLTRPRLTSSSANANSRSIRRFGTKVIVLLSTFASKRSPTTTPALARICGGSVTW